MKIVFIDNMVEILGFFFKLGIEHTNAFFHQCGVFVTTITTIINNIITVILANLNIIHVVTACAKFHFEYILLLVYIYRFMLFFPFNFVDFLGKIELIKKYKNVAI